MGEATLSNKNFNRNTILLYIIFVSAGLSKFDILNLEDIRNFGSERYMIWKNEVRSLELVAKRYSSVN